MLVDIVTARTLVLGMFMFASVSVLLECVIWIVIASDVFGMLVACTLSVVVVSLLVRICVETSCGWVAWRWKWRVRWRGL